MKCLTALAAGALFAGAAQAGNVTVHYHDSDLASPAAAGSFYKTLDHAARQACRSGEALSPEVRRVTQQCRDIALSLALADLDHDYLWMHHDKSRNATIVISRQDKPANTAGFRIGLAKQPGLNNRSN